MLAIFPFKRALVCLCKLVCHHVQPVYVTFICGQFLQKDSLALSSIHLHGELNNADGKLIRFIPLISPLKTV